MRPLHRLFFIIAATGLALGQNPMQVAERLAAQNALFEEQYESDLRNFPERATAFGDYRYNDRLAEYSLDAIFQRHKTDEAFLARLRCGGGDAILLPFRTKIKAERAGGDISPTTAAD